MIAIIDYGVGNLRSVEKAFHYIGSDARIVSDPGLVLKSDAVVLPGVGAFADAMKSLRDAGMAGVVGEAISRGMPLLGICLGMQLLFEYSDEGGERVEGLGAFKGSVKLLPSGMNLKVPHMGWNSIDIRNGSGLFKGLPENPYVYFVHSYYLDAEDKDIVAATASYGIKFDAAVSSGKVCATQFHPEKSGAVGLSILKNWLGTINN